MKMKRKLISSATMNNNITPTSNEASKSCNNETTTSLLLLEKLRQRLVVVPDPITTEEEARQKKKLILEHLSEFPSKLRPAIAAAAAVASQPETFLSEVYQAVTAFVFGRSVENEAFAYEILNGNVPEGVQLSVQWHGLNSDIDTEDEAELAIRFFPRVLTEELSTDILGPGMHIQVFRPIHLLITSPKAVSFVPLFLKLDADRGGRRPLFFHQGILLQLLVNRYPKNLFGEEGSSELDEESLLVLTRMGLVKTDAIYGLISWLFEQAGVLQSAFVERRLRLLIDRNPSVLINSNISGSSLLNSFQEYDYSLSVINSVGLMILETILELGIIHFPTQLGFAFHEFNFHSLCGNYGRERVQEIFRDKLIGTLRQHSSSNYDIISNSNSSSSNNNNITLKALVLAAATNKNISLDGVYTLVRCDPVALLADIVCPPSTFQLERRNSTI